MSIRVDTYPKKLDIHLMIFEYANNDLTSGELLEFVIAAFGCQINGKPFKSYHVNNWIRLGKIPDVYGGFKILNVEDIKGLRNCKVLVLDGLTRSILEDIQNIAAQTSDETHIINRPRKQRTRLYYEMLEKVSKQYTRKSKEAATISDQWKVIGIKRNQFIN